MAKKQKQGIDISHVWQGMAGFINQLPNDEREQYRKAIGNFMHDMKHTLGLIINANEIVRRDLNGCPEEIRAEEMIDIIKKGSQQLDGYLNTILENFCHRIVEE